MSGSPGKRKDRDEAARARREQTLHRLREVQQEILARAPEHTPEPSLERVAQVMELLGDPQHAFPVIHLTGTNGKTTTTRIIERILREMGLTTGRFTSPHMHDIRERISLDGSKIEADRFIRTYEDVLPYVQMVDERSQAEGGPRMTYFEILVVIAYAAFADTPVDVAVVEVGLGGRWDATNVADGTVAVVTPISLDHTRLLGSTIGEITLEKRDIIKPGASVVVGRQDPAVDELLAEKAEETGAGVVREDLQFEVTARDIAVGGQQVDVRGLAGEYRELFVPLFGRYQAHNVATAIAAVESFVGGGEQRLDDAVLQAALADVTSPGRMEVVRRSPTVVVDAAHNPAGVQALAEAVEDSFTFARLVGVVSIFKDKDVLTMLELMEPIFDEIVVTANSSHRAMPPAQLGALAIDVFGEDRVTVEQSLLEAVDRAAELSDEGGVAGGVLATGSIMTAADVRRLLGKVGE